jgi:hypothetical protein
MSVFTYLINKLTFYRGCTREREKFYITNDKNCINHNIPNRTSKDWHQVHPDYNKQYYLKNKEKHQAYMKAYYLCKIKKPIEID